jgi:hypothetical protein
VAFGEHVMHRLVLLQKFCPVRQAHLPVAGLQKKSQHS